MAGLWTGMQKQPATQSLACCDMAFESPQLQILQGEQLLHSSMCSDCGIVDSFINGCDAPIGTLLVSELIARVKCCELSCS